MNKRVKRLQNRWLTTSSTRYWCESTKGTIKTSLYLSGFGGSTAVLLITSSKAFIITDARYYVRSGAEATGFKLVKVVRGQKVPDLINEALKDAGLKKTARVGFEAGHLPVQIADLWKKSLNAKLVSSVHVVERFRQYKDDDEVAQLRHACKVTSRVYNEVAEILRRHDRSGCRLRAGYAPAQARRHLQQFHFDCGVLPNSAIPHHATGDRKLKAGEPLIMDFGGLFPGGYCSDITRTAFVPGKKPGEKIRAIYEIVLAANKAARKALKPGMMYRDFDKIARDHIDKSGYGKYFTHGLGHSLGLVAHDPYDYENDPFQAGMVVTDEPGIYIDGFGGVRIEDDLVVTADGAERLTTAPYWKF